MILLRGAFPTDTSSGSVSFKLLEDRVALKQLILTSWIRAK